MTDQIIVIERRLDANGQPYYVRMRVVDDSTARETLHCPAGHGPMRYDIGDDHLHCRCGAVATTSGHIVANPKELTQHVD